MNREKEVVKCFKDIDVHSDNHAKNVSSLLKIDSIEASLKIPLENIGVVSMNRKCFYCSLFFY